MLRLLMLLSLFLTMDTAFAQMVTYGKQGEKAMAYRLVTLTSQEQEDKTVFLGRVGRFLTNFTKNNGVEGCAVVCHIPNAARWGVVVHTNQSVLACTAVSVCPEGMSPNNTTIHSHPEMGVYNLTRVDATFRRARNDKHQDSRTFNVQRYEGFSSFDKSYGPSYLVEGGQLLYFDGRQTVNLGPVAASVLGSATP